MTHPTALVGAKPTKKLHLSALRHFFDQLVLRHVILLNPAASVRAPKYSVVEGKQVTRNIVERISV